MKQVEVTENQNEKEGEIVAQQQKEESPKEEQLTNPEPSIIDYSKNELLNESSEDDDEAVKNKNDESDSQDV